MSEIIDRKWSQFQKLYNEAMQKYEDKVAELEEREKKHPGFEDTEIGKRMRESLEKFEDQVETWRKQIEVAGKKVQEIVVHKKDWESKKGDYKALQGRADGMGKTVNEGDNAELTKSHDELITQLKDIDKAVDTGEFKDAVEKYDRANEFANLLEIRIKKLLGQEDDKTLDPSDAKQIQSDIELIQKGFKVFEDAGGKIPSWISGPIKVLKISVDSSVDVLDSIELATAALRKYQEAVYGDAEKLPDKEFDMDEFNQKNLVKPAMKAHQALNDAKNFLLNWENPESVTSHFVKKTIERYAPDYIANNWDKIAQQLR